MKLKAYLWIPAFAGMTLLAGSVVSAYAVALPGDPALLEAVGTTPVAETQEKVLFSYTIRPGDTLWDIAKWVLKDPFQWPELLKYNYIKNPDLIYPGGRLVVPSPEVLERVRRARDVQEIEAIRREAETGAVVRTLGPAAGGQAPAFGTGVAVSPAAEEIIRMPVMEPEDLSAPEKTSDLKISGRKNIAFQYREYRGGTSPNYFSSGYTRQESLNLTLQGQIMNQVKVEGEFYQSDQSLENKYSLKLSTDQMELLLGDFSAALPDTEYVLSGRNLSGGRFTADFENAGGVAVAGAAKGVAQYEKFYGNNTQGPYYLKSAPVVFGSEKIMVNKKNLQRGTDYTFDYLSGRISFLRQAIDSITLVEAVYESRQTVYPRSLYATRLWGKPVSWLRVAGSVAREEDPETMGVADLGGGNTLTPIGHWVWGTDLTSDIPGFGELTGEFAFSQYQPNRLVPEKSEGQALKAKTSGSLGPVGIQAFYRKTSPDFKRVGGSELGSDLLNYGGKLDLKTGDPFTLAGEYEYKDVLLNGLRENTRQAGGLAKLFLRQWPSLTYEYYQLQEQNDAVALAERLDHQTVRHSGMIGMEQDFYAASLRGEQEVRDGELAGRSSATTRSVEMSANSKNLGWFTMSGLLNYQQVEEKANSMTAAEGYEVTKARINGTLKPSERYLLTLDNEWVWDEVHGSTKTLDSKFTANPVEMIRSDGKYTWETLQSLIGSQYRPVYTQTASGQLELLPLREISLRLAPSLRWTSLADSGGLLNKTRTDLITLKWAMRMGLSHEVEAKRDLYVLADSTDPGLRFQTEQQSRKGTYAVKVSFSNALSGDGRASYEQFGKNNYNSAAAAYDRLNGQERMFALGLHSSLQAVLRIDGNYALTMRDQDGTRAESVTRTAYPISETGQTTASYDLLNSYGSLHTRQDTANGKVTLQWNELFSTYAEGVYDRNEDRTGAEPVIHTASAGLGLIVRWAVFRAEASVKLAKSWEGAQTHQENYQLTLNYNPIKFIALSLRGSHSIAKDPDSSATDATLNCSVNF